MTLRLVVYDILGREIVRLIDGKLSPGSHSINFDGSKYTSGIYFYRLAAEDFVQTKKMILVK